MRILNKSNIIDKKNGLYDLFPKINNIKQCTNGLIKNNNSPQNILN